jgi:hypothetical protein
METSTSTPSIDKKKTESSSSSSSSSLNSKNIVPYLTQLFLSFIKLVIYFSVSGYVLYAIKVAQQGQISNQSCTPDSKETPVIGLFNFSNNGDDKKSINHVVFKTEPVDDGIVKWINSKVNSNRCSVHYVFNVLKSVVDSDYFIWSEALNGLNKYMSESALVLMGPLLFMFIYIFLLFFRGFNFIFQTCVKLPELFNTYENDNWVTSGGWFSGHLIRGTGLSILFIILLCCLPIFWIGGLFALSIYELFVLVAPTPDKKEGGDTNKTIDFKGVIKGVFSFYKLMFMIIYSLMMINQTFTSFGTIPGIVVICVLAVIYLGFIGSGLHLYTPDSTQFKFKIGDKAVNDVRICNSPLSVNMKGGGNQKSLKKSSQKSSNLSLLQELKKLQKM